MAKRKAGMAEKVLTLANCIELPRLPREKMGKGGASVDDLGATLEVLEALKKGRAGQHAYTEARGPSPCDLPLPHYAPRVVAHLATEGVKPVSLAEVKARLRAASLARQAEVQTAACRG